MNNIYTDLEYLVSPDIYERLQSHNKNKVEKKDIKFYKKRVILLFKQMLKKNTNELPPSLIQSYNDFLLSAISHLKLEDKKDYLQTLHSYKDLAIEELNNEKNIEDKKNIEDEKNIDELLYNKPSKTIKDFVIIKSNKHKTNFPEKNLFKENDPILKVKGLKKENIKIIQ